VQPASCERRTRNKYAHDARWRLEAAKWQAHEIGLRVQTTRSAQAQVQVYIYKMNLEENFNRRVLMHGCTCIKVHIGCANMQHMHGRNV